MSAAEGIGAALAAQLDRALAAQDAPALLREAEAGGCPAAAWQALEELGLTLALVPESSGGAGLGWADVAPALCLLGQRGAPLPLAEAMLGNALLAAGGLPPVAGVVALEVAPGLYAAGRHAAWLLRMEEDVLRLHGARDLAWRTGRNIAGEARDALLAAPVTADANCVIAPDLLSLGGALVRSLQIAGAAQAVLAMTVEHAMTRRQFGREIGRFQAVQQMLARMAGEVAACTTAAEGAAHAADRRGLAGAAFEIACAKVMAGEAAALVAEVAHQTHGAIGITAEYGLNLLTRRLWSWRAEFGSDAAWARRLGARAIAGGPAALWDEVTGAG